MTTKEMLEKIIANDGVPDDVKAKAREVMASIDKKNAKRAEKSAENKSANSQKALDIYNAITDYKWYAVSEIVEQIIPDTTDNKNKISAIMGQGVKDGLFEETSEHKVNGKGRKVKGYRKIEEDTEDTEDDTEDTEDDTDIE